MIGREISGSADDRFVITSQRQSGALPQMAMDSN
jgi:hypothetical protein